MLSQEVNQLELLMNDTSDRCFPRDVCCMNNERRIHKDMKIAQDDSTVKLGYFVRCGLPLHVSEGYQSKLLVVQSKGVRCNVKACFIAMTEDRHYELAAMDLSMIAVALTPSYLYEF